MSNLWDTWKQGFAAWESATAAYLEQVLVNPAVLGPAGTMLTIAMKTKAATDRATASWWSSIGLPTRRDQERSLHKLDQLESRIADLEEQLADARAATDARAADARTADARTTADAPRT